MPGSDSANFSSSLFGLILYDGGTPDLFWGFIVESCGMLLVYASLAEMASMWVSQSSELLSQAVNNRFRSPTAGGQYHWGWSL